MRRTTRLGAYVASAALVLTGSLSGAGLTPALADAPIHNLIGVDQGAAWLAGNVVDGLVPGQYGGPDVGLSIDTALSLRAAGGHDDTVTDIIDAIETKGTSYLEYTYSFENHDYEGQAANATAKAMALFETVSPARTTIGSIDVQQRMESLTATDAPIAGRIGDVSLKDGTPDGADYANTLGQSFAAFALTEASSSQAEDVVSYLLKQQCSDGGFRLSFTPSRTAAAQSCLENPSPAPDSDVDTTAIVLQQLNQLPATGAVTEAISAARGYLLAKQKADGSWQGGTGTEGSNANSTGLSAAALGDGPEAQKAAQWLRAHQADSTDVCTALEADQGAIAYDDAGLAAGRTDGIDDASSDQWRRATAQALPGLAYLPVDTTPADPALSGPSGFRKAGSRASFTTSGLNDGDVLCLSGRGVRQRRAVTGTSWTVPVTLPGGTATRVYTVRDADGHSDTAAVKVLGRKKLAVHTSKSRVRRSGKVAVVVAGLQPGEHARILYKGKVKKRGTANSAGKIRTSFRVGRSTGRKRIVAKGEFSDIRRGTAVLRVRR